MHEGSDPRRVRFAAFFACLLVAAQLLFAAHADAFADHAPQSCEYCLAAAVAGDPNDLVVDLAPPAAVLADVARPAAIDFVVAQALRAASPRGPPSC